MLARGNRLTTSAEFEKLRKEGTLIQSDSFSLAFRKREDENPSKFGFIVSTKVSKNATVRNKVKRALREGVRQSFGGKTKGFDCVFLAKPISARKYTDVMMREVGVALDKLVSSK